MTTFLGLVGWNLAIALVLAAAVWLLCRTALFRRRPALQHALWLVVLLKLVTPPLVPVPMLPAEASEKTEAPELAAAPSPRQASQSFVPDANDWQASENPIAPAAVLRAGDEDLALAPSPTAHRFTWREIVGGLLAAGSCVSVVLWLVALRQFRVVRRLLRNDRIASSRAERLLGEVAARFGCQRTPGLSIVDAAVTPMLWAEPRRAAIILPRELVDGLDDEQLRSIIGHELAHFARRDHVASLLAFFVATLFWWNPLAWFARRRMSIAADACCDALALERLAGSPKTYAQTLLAVVDFIASANPLRPSLGIPFGSGHSLRTRFEMLSTANVRSKISRAGWLALALGSVSLLLLPARAEENQPTKPAEAAATDAKQPQKYYISGLVADKATGEPIEGATIDILVDAETERSKRFLTATSDAQGRYRIEVPLGDVRIWIYRLKDGYWLDNVDHQVKLATSPQRPEVVHDVGAHRGVRWPVRVLTTGDDAAKERIAADTDEIADDATRKSLVEGEKHSWTSDSSASTEFDSDATGFLTQCGTSGKLWIKVAGISGEMILDPGFEGKARITNTVQLEPTPRWETTLVDEQGRQAKITGPKVTIVDDRPLLTFHRMASDIKLSPQSVSGQIVDVDGQPIAGVRVGCFVGFKSDGGGSGEQPSVATTDQAGHFQLDVPMTSPHGAGRFDLIITKEGYAGFDPRPIKFADDSPAVIDAGKFKLKPGHSLRVRVVDPDGKPLPGAVVEPQQGWAQRRQAIRTGLDGRGEIHNLPEGMIRLQASQGTLGLRTEVLLDSTTEVTLQLKPPNSDAGVVGPIVKKLPAGSVAPQWSVIGWTDGQNRKLADYQGKVVVLCFWGRKPEDSLFCMPIMQLLAKKYAGRQDVILLGIHSPGADVAKVKEIEDKNDWQLVSAVDRPGTEDIGTTARAFGVGGPETILIVDRDGKTVDIGESIECDSPEAEAREARVIKALNLPPEDPDAPFEKQLARGTAMMAYYCGELIDAALAAK